jgi:putative protein-disulfide isomerase
MKILTLNNRSFDLNELPEEVDEDTRFSVLDNSNPNDPDFFFMPLIFLESFNSPAILLRIGGYEVQMPLDWCMVVGDREGPIGDFADYILGAYKKVDEYSGMLYGQPYLDQLKTKTIWSSSIKPSIAIETFKQFSPKEIVEFSHAIQIAYFVDGKDLRDEEVYKELIKQYGINEAEFIGKLNSEEMRKQTNDWFQTIANWGVTGYPMVILVRNNKYYAITKGFTDLETLKKTAASVVEQH